MTKGADRDLKSELPVKKTSGDIASIKAPMTLLAYEKDLKKFAECGGRIPSSPDRVLKHLEDHSGSHKLSTLKRWLVSICLAHIEAGYESPSQSKEFRKAFKSIKDRLNTPQRRVSPITAEILQMLVDKAPDNLIGKRLKAILLIAFSGAMRRSECTSIWRLSV